MLFVLLSKRFLRMTVLDGFAFVAIHANLSDCYRVTPSVKALRLCQLPQGDALGHYRKGYKKSTTHSCAVLFLLVEITGIEPVTSCMPCKRSPS